MRVKIFMLLMCVFSSGINQQCSSGNGGSLPEDGKSKGRVVVHQRSRDQEGPSTLTMTHDYYPSYTPQYIQPVGHSPKEEHLAKLRNELFPNTTTSSSSSVINPIAGESQKNQGHVGFPHSREEELTPEEEDGYTGEAKVVEKEEEKKPDKDAPTPPLAASNDLEMRDLTLGFLLPSRLKGFYIASEKGIYTLLIYESLSIAEHPDVLATIKLAAIKEDKLESSIDMLKNCLMHWGNECGKNKKATDIFEEMQKNISNAASTQMGIKIKKFRCNLLIRNKNGQVLLLAVPKLSTE